jgi:5,10-methylenetetrahydromethanopterin reductase
MRIGVGIGMGDGNGLEGLARDAREAEERGFASVWMANIFGFDAISALGAIGHATERVELGTAVVPTYPRHPFAMAQQALTAQAACHGRFALGVGLSHQIVIQNMLGMSFERPARHMREYLEVLGPLLRQERVDHRGPQYEVHAQIQVPGVAPVPLLVAALGPVMLRVTGELADGTILWMTGPETIDSHIAPRITRAAEAAGRAAPRIVCGLPVALTEKPDDARAVAAKLFQLYGQLPSYRAMLDREGAEGPADVAIVGDERAIDEGLARLRDAGVTDFNAAPFPSDDGAVQRTVELLADRARGGAR